MARTSRIRITQNDKAEYAKLAKNAKAKIRRTFKNFGVNLEEEIPVPKLEEFKTRKEFNQWKEKISSFTNRHNQHYQFKKNKYGTVATKAEINQIARNRKLEQRLADEKIKKLEKLPFFSRGKQQPGGMAQRIFVAGKEEDVTGINRPVDFNFETVPSRKRLEQIMDYQERRTEPGYYNQREEKMLHNFIKKLADSFNSIADELIAELEDMPPDLFYQMYLMSTDFDFNDFYTIDPDDARELVNNMLEFTRSVKNGDVNFDLKDFPNS